MCELNKDNTNWSKLRVGNDFWCSVEISQQETTHRTPRPVSLSSSILPPRHRSPEVAFQPEARQPSGSFRKMGISIWGLKERQNLPKVCQVHLMLIEISCDYIIIWCTVFDRTWWTDALLWLSSCDANLLGSLLTDSSCSIWYHWDWTASMATKGVTGVTSRCNHRILDTLEELEIILPQKNGEQCDIMWYLIHTLVRIEIDSNSSTLNNQLYETCGNCQRPWTKQDLCFYCSYVAIILSMMYSMMWFSSTTAAAF